MLRIVHIHGAKLTFMIKSEDLSWSIMIYHDWSWKIMIPLDWINLSECRFSFCSSITKSHPCVNQYGKGLQTKLQKKTQKSWLQLCCKVFSDDALAWIRLTIKHHGLINFVSYQHIPVSSCLSWLIKPSYHLSVS